MEKYPANADEEFHSIADANSDEPSEIRSSEEDAIAVEQPDAGRRRFLIAGSAGVAGLALAGQSEAQSEGGKRMRTLAEVDPQSMLALREAADEADTVEMMAPDIFYQELPQLRVISSSDDMLETTLESASIERVVPSPEAMFRFDARTYGTDAVGAQLRVRPGQVLRLDFVNTHGPNGQPPPTNNTCPSSNHNTPNCLNTTNIHTHGLHVSPEEPSDDVFIQVWPKDDPLRPSGPKNKNGRFSYIYQIPWDHAPGTHWYHAHRHGSTAYNVSQGQFGSLIVEEPPNQRILPGIRDETLILAEALHRQPGGDGQQGGPRSGMNPLFTINGVNLPTIRMRPNEIQRWRLISASGTRVGYNPIMLCGDFEAWLVAWDGITLTGPPRKLNLSFRGDCINPSAAEGSIGSARPLVLSPGNRADILVKAPARPTKVASLMRMGTKVFKTCDDPRTPPPRTPGFPNPNQQASVNLAYIDVGGPPATPPNLPRVLPASKAAYLTPITDAEVARNPKRTVSFAVTGNNQTPNRFRIGYKDSDGNSYGPEPYSPDFAIRVPFNNIEEWTIENIAEQDHPFHIHVNPFQIVEIKHADGTIEEIPFERRVWSDTVNVPRRGHVKIRSRFVTFRGRFVLHCHILNHEDRGMMMDVEVV